VHARRPFFAMADIEENARRKAAGKKEIPLSPIAIEVVRRIDALFAIERSINGKSPEERAVRRAISRPRVDDLMAYMRLTYCKTTAYNVEPASCQISFRRESLGSCWPGTSISHT
jgi:hypothetical protein